MLVGGALRESETLHLEQTLLQDHLQCSDRDTTYEALEEAVARESYLTWLREQEMRTRSGQHSVEVLDMSCIAFEHLFQDTLDTFVSHILYHMHLYMCNHVS